MTWKEFVLQAVIDYCNGAGSRTFALSDLLNSRLEDFQAFRPNNKHTAAKVRQQLQFLRNDGKLSFLDNSGHYTLRSLQMLRAEIEETKLIDLSREEPEKREYIVETYVRNVTWAKQARERLGDKCLCTECTNTFLRNDGTRYIEVHHIVPLCQGGEDGLWNLSVLCAHHHRMAHYADHGARIKLQSLLLEENRLRLQ